jgi:hypothetical protein
MFFVWLRKYCMRFYEFTLRLIKPVPPLTPAQARIKSLKGAVERDKQQLRNEKERQRQQRDNESKRKEQQRKSNALKKF